MASMVHWNAVHLLALTVCSLLLVATFSEARPRIRTDASSSACSLACPPSPHWRGYRPGRVYRYHFEQGIELATDLPNGGGNQRRNLNSSGVFEVRAITECELAVSVSEASANAGADYAAPRTAPSRLARALRLPLRVWHREGRFEQLCPTEGEGEGEGETRESLNLKRALLSQLQVASGQRGRWHQLEERDILGDCWTEYIPEGPNSLLKTKDLARCRMLAFEAYPLKGEKGIPDERIQASRPVTLGSLACRLELHAEFDIPRDVACKELRSTSETSAAGDARLATRTRLRLLQPEPETGEPETEPTPWTAGRRTDLRQEHRSSVECQTSSRFDIGSECLERAAAAGGEGGSDAQDAAWRLVSELCREASAKSLGRETPGKFAELVGQLRRMQSRVQLNRIYQRLLGGFCSENPSLKGVVRSAIAAAGTRPALQLILQQILSERNSWSVDALSQLPHPTVGMLQDVLDFVNRRRSRGNWQGEALALGDLVYRVCREHRGCGTDPAVARVVRFFSDQLGSEEACSRLQVGSCYTADAFVALLAVGNMGRAGGGASALVGCAANPRLALAHRVFALQSLRRFDYDKDNEAGAGARDRLARLLLDGALDAELRIAAYRALAAIGLTGQRADSLRSAVRRLLTSPNEDRQTQLFVRTHLSGLAGGASDPLLDKAAVAEAAKLLQEAAESAPDIAKELDRLSWREYSSAWRLQHFSHDWATGGRIEASVVFSPQSAIPRYIGLNLTLIDPGRGRQVNALELGLRIEGVDDEAHEAYKLFAQRFGASKSPGMDIFLRRRVRRQTVGVDLTPEQESRMQAAQEPRVDIVVRQSGAEVSHSTVSGIGLTAPLQLLKNIDFSTIRQLMEALPQFKKFFDSKRSSMSAGVLSEEAVSLPTISGAPLIVKSSAHYLTELRLDKVLDLSWTGNSSARLELRPRAALRQSRTVSVDAPFERMGVRTNLSFLTNTGLGLSLERARSDEADSDQTISMKLEPLDKRQSLADAKTDAAFFWHAIGADGEATPVEQPLVPSEVMEQSVRCTDNFIKKHSGLKLCVQSKKVSSASSSSASGDTASLLSSLRRSPGSFQLYLEKNDSLGGFELYFRQKRPTPLDPGNNWLELLIGDRNSPDRMLKLALRSSRSTGSSSWRFELINPVFPVSLFAQVTNSTSESQLQADVRIGSVEYKAEGAAQWASADSPQMRLAGSFYRKDKVRQRVEISLAHRMDGRVLVLLPRASTAFNLTLQSGNQLRLLYDLQTAAANFTWKIASEYASPAGVLHSVQYQLKYENKFNNSRRDYGAVIYDLEVRNAEGRRVGHSLHAKLQRSIGAISRANVSVLHQLRLGSALRRSPLDFKLQVGLSETINGATFSAEGNGQLTYYRRDTGQEVTAKLEGLRVSMEENSNIDPVGTQSLYEINCGLGYEGYKASYKGVLRYLPRRDWGRLRQAFELQLGAQLLDGSIGSEVTHYWHLKNYVFMPDGGRQIASAQIARVVYANETLLHIDHRLNRESPLAALRHDLLVQSKLISQLKLNSSVSLAQEGIMSIDTSFEFSSSQVFQCKQKFEYIGLEEDHQVKHRAQLLLKNLYVLESDARVSRETAASLLRFLLYQRRIVAGRYNFRYSLALFARFLASMRFNETSRLTGPEPDRRTVLENVIDLAQTNGTVWKNQLMAHFDGSEVFNYGLLLERQSRDEVQRLRAFQVEAFGSGQSFRTRLEARMKSSASQAETRLNLTSGDTWGWHRVEADAAVLIKGEQSLSWRENAETEAASQLHFDTKLTGHVLNRRIDSNGMIGIWKQISSTGRVFRVTSAAGTPKANATFNLKLLRSPEVLQLTNSLTNSLTFLPFRQLGSTIDVKSTPGTSYASLLSEFQVDNDKVASAKALHSPAVSLIDVKTKHPNFQEIKLKIGREQLTGLAGETNFTAIAKFHAFGWKVGARQSGIVTANTNPAKYKRLVSVRGDLELVGLENYIQRKRFNGEALLQLKHSNEFDLLFSVATPSPAGIELPLLRLSSNFEFAPLRAELKLRTAGSSGRLLSYGARVEFEPSRKANADVEFGERRAELGWSLQPSLGGAGHSAQFLARNSFLVAQPVFVHGVLNSTWPLRAEPLEASMEVRLSSTRFPGMSMRLVNYLERKLALLSIIAQPDNSVTDVFRLSYNQSADFEGIRGDTFAKFDLSSFSENIATRSVRVKYLFGVEKELHFEASQDSTAIHTGRILWYSEPRQVASVRGVAEAADFVVAIKSQRSWAVYLARSPIAASRSSVWHLSYDQFNDANQLSTPFSAKVEISDPWSVRNGEVSIYEKTFELRTHPAGGIELVVKTGAPVLYRVLWSSSGDSGTAGDKSMRLEIRVDDSITVAEIVRRPGQAVVTYGRQDAPNTLTVAYTVSGNRMNLTVSHRVDSRSSSAQILPGVTVPLPATPFRLAAQNRGGLKGDFQLSLASSAAGSLTYGHSLSRLPRALSARANLTGPRGDTLWQLSADLERGERIAEIRTSLNGVFHFVLAEQLLQFRSSDVADLSLAFPSFRTSRTNQGGVGAKAVSLNLTVPLLGLRRSVELAAEHQLVENGRKVVLSYGRAGAEMLNGYLTVTEQTDHGVNFSVEAQLTSNAGLLWSATTVKTQMSAGMLRGEDNYTMAFSSRVFVDGIENSAVTAGLLGGSGGWPSRPSRGSARAAGFTDWEVGFDLSRPDGSKSLGGRLVRWAGAQVGPYSANASLGSTGQPGGRDFRFETESPQRHFVVAKEFDPNLDRKSLKFFINRRLNHGLVVALQRGPEPQQRALEFELPTRLIRVEIRPLQSRSESSSGLGVRVAWDAARAPDREIRLDLMAGSEGSVWAASATCEAPFLLDLMTLELRREDGVGRSALVLRQLAGDRETARAQVGFEQQLRRIDLLLGTSGPTVGDGASSRLSATVEIDGDSLDDESRRRRLHLFLGDVRIEVPSHGVNKSFKFVYRPMREFTCAGDNGSAISLRFAPGQRLDRFTVFASGNDRQAARLDAVLDKRRSRLTAALDTGLGGFDFPADLRASRRFGGGSGGPGFRPNATLVFASAGVSDDGRRAHAAVLVGRMRFGQWPDPAEPASVPAGLNLFSLGLRLHGNNSMEGSSAWRSERVDGVKSAVAHLKESLLDTWMASGLRAFGSATDALLRAAGERLLKSVDAKRLAEEATNPLLADLTALKLYAEAVVEAVGSDPRLGAIVRLLKRFSGAASWRVAELSDWLASRLSEGGVGLVDLRLAERVQLAADAAVEFVDSLPLLAAWRAGLDAGKSAAGLVSDWLSGCLEVSDSFLRRMLSSGAAVSGRDGATASVLRLLSERASQLLSLGSVKAEMAKALLQIELALQAAVSDSLGLLADDLLPFAIGHLGDLVRLKKWLDDALYELRLWIDFGAGSGAAQRQERLLSWPLRLARQLAGPGSLGYWRNLEDSWRLLSNGEFAAAVRRMLMTDAYGLRVWRPVCDAKCRESGDAAFAAVVGDVYPPVYLDSLSPRVWRRRLARVRSIRATARRFRDRLFAEAEWATLASPLCLRNTLQLRLFAASSDCYVLLSMFNDWRQMDAGLWDPLARQLAMRHRTAVLAGGRSLITFDGISLVNPLPCSYVLAHDFRLNEFTVAQSYREVNGTAVRHDLLVRFGSVQYSISPSGVLKVNGRIEKLPMSRYVGGRLVQAERKKSRLLVRFHGETLRNTLLLRCNSITDSCLLRVHPLYQARVDGMAGSNDGHRANDLQGGSRDSHIRYWTSGRCLATETGGPDATLSPAVESPEAEANCQLWFSRRSFSFDKCFSTVNPRPYLDLCRAFARLGKDICEVAVQYTDRCRNELVNINTPYSCVRCRVDEETTIVKDDLISEPRVLRKRLQAVFLLENSDCVASAIGLRGSYISYLAKLIERLNMSYPDLKSVEFGLAHFGGQGEPVLTAHPIHDTSRRFGNLADLNAGLVKVRLNGTSVHQFDVLKALAALQTQYAWEPLAQKHIFLFSCQTCTARSWDYARAFDKAFKVVSSEIFLHVLTKRGIPRPTRINDWLQNLIGYDRREVFYSDRRAEPIGSLTALNPSGDCSAELAMDSYNKASGTVWHLDRFAASRSHSVKISRRIFAWLQTRLERPLCQRCSCALSDSLVGQPRCQADNCQ